MIDRHAKIEIEIETGKKKAWKGEIVFENWKRTGW